MTSQDLNVVRQAIEARLKVLLAEPRVQEALALQRWLAGKQSGPPPTRAPIAGPPPSGLHAGHHRIGRPVGSSSPNSLISQVRSLYEQAQPGAMDVRELHERMQALRPGVQLGSVSSRAGELARQGILERVGHGRYRLTTTPTPTVSGEFRSEH